MPRGQVAVILTGLQGSGKSTAARMLSCMLAAHLISSDVIRNGLKRIAYDRETGDMVYEIMGVVMGEFLKMGVSVVLDGTFTEEARRGAAIGIAKRAHVRSVLIHMTAAEDVVRERIRARQQRNPTAAGYDVYLKGRGAYEFPKTPRVIVNNSRSKRELAHQLLSIVSSLQS